MSGGSPGRLLSTRTHPCQLPPAGIRISSDASGGGWMALRFYFLTNVRNQESERRADGNCEHRWRLASVAAGDSRVVDGRLRRREFRAPSSAAPGSHQMACATTSTSRCQRSNEKPDGCYLAIENSTGN